MIFDKSLITNGKVLIDTREGKRKDKAIKFFGSENCEVRHLETGDFILNVDGENKVGIEVKQVKTDLFSSLDNKRLFRQVSRMITEFPIHYVLIIGNPVEHIVKMQIKKKKYPYMDWNYSVNKWNGAYTSLCQVTQVVFANNPKHAIRLMNLLFKKSTDGKNRVYNYLEKFNNPAVTYLSCINGIGQNKSELICEELHLETLKDLLCLNGDDLTSINGIGHKTAVKIMEALK
ncbi:MAG: hypothetical protein LBM02_08095 [Lachnospiraceae bacterium]|jgi:ERCC4-type nuclease|nr:hypothetical protein [Lachnospiraceae bacterium]